MVSGSSKKDYVSAKQRIFSCFLGAHEPDKTLKWQHLTKAIFFMSLLRSLWVFCTHTKTWFLIFVLVLSRKEHFNRILQNTCLNLCRLPFLFVFPLYPFKCLISVLHNYEFLVAALYFPGLSLSVTTDMTLCIDKHVVWRGGNLRVSSLGKLALEQGALAFASQVCSQHLWKKQTENPRCSASWLPQMIGKPEGVAIYEYNILFPKNIL